MYADQLFALCNGIAGISWLLLIILPWWWSDKLIIGIVIILFALVYAWLLFSNFSFSDISSFGSLSGVMELFRKPEMVTAGWIHYLAFDLLAGIFIRRNAIKHGISKWVIIPCLLLTFMFGPVGLLLYLLIRWSVTRQYFADNF